MWFLHYYSCLHGAYSLNDQSIKTCWSSRCLSGKIKHLKQFYSQRHNVNLSVSEFPGPFIQVIFICSCYYRVAELNTQTGQHQSAMHIYS